MAKTIGVSEAAREFGLSESLIYSAVSRGDLPGVTRLGKRIILNRKRLEEFLEGGNSIGDNISTLKAPKKRHNSQGRAIPEFVATVIESFAAEGMTPKEIWRRMGGKRAGEEVVHDNRAFRMPSYWTVQKYARRYHVRLKQDSTAAVRQDTDTVQQETNEVNRHRITIGNTFDCVNCGERFKKNHRLILTAMQGGDGRGESRLTSYALCGASCLIEFTTKKEQEQWILTPLRSKKDLEPAETQADGHRSLWRRFRALVGGKE